MAHRESPQAQIVPHGTKARDSCSAVLTAAAVEHASLGVRMRGVEEALRACADVCRHEMAMPKIPMPQSHSNDKALPGWDSGKCQRFPSRSMCGCWQCVQKMSTAFCQLPPPNVYGLMTALLEHSIPTEISRSHLCDSAVCHKPCLHIQVYALTPLSVFNCVW